MDILIVMCLGILVGRFFFPEKGKRINEFLQLGCTLVLIFSMGVMLGHRDNFFGELFSLGWTSFLFCLIPTVLSIILVYVLSRKFIEKENQGEK